MDLKEIVAAVNETKDTLIGLLNEQKTEIKTLGETSEQTAARIEEAEKSLAQAMADVEGLQKQLEEMETKRARLPFGDGPRKSVGANFVESEQYKHLLQNPGVNVTDSVHVKMFGGRKATLTNATTGDLPAFASTTDRDPTIVPLPATQMHMRDLIPVMPTASNAVEFVQQTGFTSAAAVRAEGKASAESTITLDVKQALVKTISHHIPVTREMLNDVAGIQQLVETDLLNGILDKEDNLILYGNGTTEFEGILQNASIQTFNWSECENADDNKMDALLYAFTKQMVAKYPVSGAILHPNDWRDIQILKASDGQYIWVQVTVGGVKQLWQVPIIPMTCISEGTYLAGAFASGSVLREREEGAIRISDSHNTNFTKGILVILGEERVTLANKRPESFITGSFDSAPTGSGSGS